MSSSGAWQVWSAFSGEAFDVGGLHEPVTNPSRITIPITGKYMFIAAMFIPCTSTTKVYLRIRKNGNDDTTIGYNGDNYVAADSNYYPLTLYSGASGSSGSQHAHVVSMDSCVATDYYEVQVFRGSSVDWWLTPTDNSEVRFEAMLVE